MIALTLLFAGAQLEPPKTVNGIILGKAEDFTTPGPARVCMRELMITARSGESVSLGYSGIHHGTLRLNRGRSWVEAALGEIWAQPAQRGDVIERRDLSYVADSSTETKLRYGLYAHDDFYGEHRALVWIEGPSLTGDERDRSVLRRIELRSDRSPPCDVTYNFGWPVIFGEEPVIESKSE